MEISKNIRYFYFISALFILINIIFIANENYTFIFIPISLLIALLVFFSLDRLILLIVFFTPISVQLSDFVTDLPIDMSLPTEPIIFGIMIVFFIKLFLEKKFDNRIWLHPTSIAIFVYLAWVLFTSITSTMPLVSLKFFISRLWFIVVFYFLATQIFKRWDYIKIYVWCYILPMLFVIGYTLYGLSHYSLFDQKMAHVAMVPFFNDHTSYAAAIAMLVPIAFGYLFSTEIRFSGKMIFFLVLLVFIFGIIFSYTRASWVSIAGAFAFWCVLKLKINLKYVFAAVLCFVFLFVIFKQDIVMKLEANKQDSSTNFSEHVQSISNVSTDASNVERLNRWSCAYRMFLEKPLIGWGPGTYMFKYAPFQLSYERTIISTNVGDRGNAHSEYIGPLAESGFLGLLTFLFIVLYTIYTASKIYKTSPHKEVRIITMMLILGLMTYYIHGFLNNFLDTDKASVLFWGFTAMIVALDVYHKKVKDATNCL